MFVQERGEKGARQRSGFTRTYILSTWYICIYHDLDHLDPIFAVMSCLCRSRIIQIPPAYTNRVNLIYPSCRSYESGIYLPPKDVDH